MLGLGRFAAEVADFFVDLGVFRFHGDEKIAVFRNPPWIASFERKHVVRLHELKVAHLPGIAKIIGSLEDNVIHLENVA